MMPHVSEHSRSPSEHSLNTLHRCRRVALCFTNLGRKSSHDRNRNVTHGCWLSINRQHQENEILPAPVHHDYPSSKALQSKWVPLNRLLQSPGRPVFNRIRQIPQYSLSGFTTKTEKAKCVAGLGDRCQRVSNNCSQLEKMTEIKKSAPFNNRGPRKPWVR